VHRFSRDDGCWAAGSYVDGDDPARSRIQWGHCNLNSADVSSGDGCRRVYVAGIKVTRSGIRSAIYVTTSMPHVPPQPQPPPVAHPPPPSPSPPPPVPLPPAPRMPPLAGSLWGITSASKCAEQLPYGPSSAWDSTSPYICTDCVPAHDAWEQVFMDGATELYRMTWRFSSPKTLEARFDAATQRGEQVAWTITRAGAAPVTISGTWRWSRNSRGWPSDASGVHRFSRDDGCWAAGSYVDGDDPARSRIQWGHCNLNSADRICSMSYEFGSRRWVARANLRTFLTAISLSPQPSPPPAPPPPVAPREAMTCTMTPAQQSQSCTCRLTFSQGSSEPTGTQLLCD